MLSTGHQAGVFFHALPVRAVDGRVHAYTDRERHSGRGRGGYTAAETVNESVTDSH